MLHKEKSCVFGVKSGSPVSIWTQENGKNGRIRWQMTFLNFWSNQNYFWRCWVRYTNSITGGTTFQQPQSVCGGILADGMGLGKSLTTLCLITSTMDQAKRFAINTAGNLVSGDTPMLLAKSTLIIAPASSMFILKSLTIALPADVMHSPE